MRTPPSTRPRLAPPTATKENTLNALVRSRCSGNMGEMMPSTMAATMAALAPCTKRAPTSTPAVGRQAAQHGGDHEGGQAGEEDPGAAEQVTEPAAQQEQAAEGQKIGVDDPGQRGLGEVQLPLNGRQGHVHRGPVQHDHQLPGAQHDQRDPAPPPWRRSAGAGEPRGARHPGGLDGRGGQATTLPDTGRRPPGGPVRRRRPHPCSFA